MWSFSIWPGEWDHAFGQHGINNTLHVGDALGVAAHQAGENSVEGRHREGKGLMFDVWRCFGVPPALKGALLARK